MSVIEQARKTLVSQTSEQLFNKLKNEKLMGASKEAAIEILVERKGKGKFDGDLTPYLKAKTKEVPKVEKAPKVKAEKVKVEKVKKAPKEKKEKEVKSWKINGETYTHGDKVKLEAAGNSSLKGKKVTGVIVSAFEDSKDKATVLRIKTSEGNVMLTKKLDKVEFI